MRKTLIVVDMQNDFIDGALGTKEAQSIVSNVAKKIKEYKENGCNVIFTRDTHPTNYLETYEGKHLPVVHCVSNFMGFLKGKSSLMIYEKWGNMKYKYRNRQFWCRGYYVSTVGKNEKKISEYIQTQLNEDRMSEQLTLELTDPFTGSRK